MGGFDKVTLFVVQIILNMQMAVIFYVIWRMMPRYRWLGLLIAENIIYIVTLPLILLQGHASPWLTYVLVNVLLTLAPACILSAIMVILGEKHTRWPMIVFPALMLPMIIISYFVLQSLFIRIMISTLMNIVIFMVIAVKLLAVKKSSGTGAYRIMAGIFVFVSLLLVGRIVILVLTPYIPSVLTPDSNWSFVMMIMIVTTLLLAAGFVLLMMTLNDQLLGESMAKLENVSKEREKMLAILGHDLRGSLGSLDNVLQTLLQTRGQNIDVETRTLLESARVLSSGQRSLLTHLLEWLKARKEGLVPRMNSILPADVFDGEMKMLTEMAQQKKQTLRISLQPGLYCLADAAFLKTVFRNLVTNALKFTPQGGLIEVATSLKNKQFCLTVMDNGPGINNQALSDLLYTTPGTDGEKGLGLGLSICRELVEKMKGTLSIRALPDQGTLIEVILALPVVSDVLKEHV